MKIENKNIFIWLFVVVVGQMSCMDLNSQTTQQKPSREAAMDAYSKGDYEKAYNEFIILGQSFSKDPLYKYYTGVCLVKMNRHPEDASVFLRDALNGSLDIRSIPDDAWFYLGRAQQMGGKYADAIKSYNNFEKEVGKKRARDLNISGYIQDCNEGRGRIKDSDYQYNDLISKANPVTKDSSQKLSDVKVSEQPVTKPIPQKANLPGEYDKLLSQAMSFQVKADSLNTLVSDLKKEYPRLPASQQPAAKSKISEMELKAAEYQKLADEKFGNTGSRPATSTNVVVPPSVPDPKKSKEIYSLFSVETDIRDQKISIDPDLPEGLVYQIQMGVFSKPPELSFFKGISPASGFRVKGTEATKYFVGMFRRMSDANQSLLTLKQMGFKDSYITAVLDGKPVSIERASLLENEWGQKPLIKIVPVQKSVETAASTLVFRVEVTRSVKPVGEEATASYRRMAGSRGFEIIKTEDGTLIYLIGKFITFEGASEYADLLKRNGYRDAKVTAYMGSKEIPVETAKQLFEK
jgi:hypothetical protein